MMDATLQRKQFVEDGQEDKVMDPALNTRRLSCLGQTQQTWNDIWQHVCDLVCDGESAGDLRTTEKAREYIAHVTSETTKMSETIFKHFLCPSRVRNDLQDGLCDKDGGYFLENGAVFVNPLHVRCCYCCC